jgi:probable rRNA maturation factor
VNDRRMRILNRRSRGIDRTTDVLSFQQMEMSQLSNLNSQPFLLGDIVINLHKAKRQAEEYGHSLQQEMKKLLIHGLLHLIGFDHEKGGFDEKKMKRKERELLRNL